MGIIVELLTGKEVAPHISFKNQQNLVELGVYDGSNAWDVLRRTPRARYFGVDLWGDDAASQDLYRTAQMHVQPFNASLWKGSSLDALLHWPLVRAGPADLIFIDTN